MPPGAFACRQGHACLIILPSDKPSTRSEALALEALLAELLKDPGQAAHRWGPHQRGCRTCSPYEEPTGGQPGQVHLVSVIAAEVVRALASVEIARLAWWFTR